MKKNNFNLPRENTVINQKQIPQEQRLNLKPEAQILPQKNKRKITTT